MGGEPVALENDGSGEPRVALRGDWNLASLSSCYGRLSRQLSRYAGRGDLVWDLEGIESLDSFGAGTLWRAWRERFPVHVRMSAEQENILRRIAEASQVRQRERRRGGPLHWLVVIGSAVLTAWRNGLQMTVLIGQLVLDVAHAIRHPGDFPWREISANLYKSGVRAMPVTALVGFLIGVVLSYLSALQLKNFGADLFIINILGIGITRELGPVLVAVLVAGRSGSAMTAQLGVMRVTEEIDALATMGISRTLRLVLPKIVALSIAMPLLVLWTSSIALIGGMVSAQIQLDISYGFFFDTLPKVVPIANLWIALVKGIAFGFLIAIVASHYGLRVRPNTESLSSNTTASVVSAITIVILVDAIFAIATRNVGTAF